MNIDTGFMVAAVVVCLAAAGLDIKTRRIPNRLTYSAAVAALLFRAIFAGWHGLLMGILGGLLGGGVFLVFYVLHTMGAGDVKLMAAVGCLLGPQKVIEAALATAIAGGVLALFYAVAHKRLRRTFANVKDLLRFHYFSKAQAHPTLNLANPDTVRMPYGVAIAVGVAYTLFATIHLK